MKSWRGFFWWCMVLAGVAIAFLFGASASVFIRTATAVGPMSSALAAATDRLRRHNLSALHSHLSKGLPAAVNDTDTEIAFVPRAGTTTPAHRVLLFTSWFVFPKKGSRMNVPNPADDEAACQKEYSRLGSGSLRLFDSVMALDKSVHLLLLTNLPCSPKIISDVPQLRDVSTVIRVASEGSFHAWDERWVRLELLLRFIRQQWCTAEADLCTPLSDPQPISASEYGPSAEAQHSLAVLVARFPWPHFSYTMLMDMRDTFLLQPPSQFFARHPGNAADLFLASEVMQAFYSGFLAGKYRSCKTRMAGIQDAFMLNAGLVGGRTHAMEWLAGRVRRRLLAAKAAAFPCLRSGVDMVFVNVAIYEEAAAAGVTVSVGPPFAAINRAGQERLHIEYPLSLGWAGFEGLPNGGSGSAPVVMRSVKSPEGRWVDYPSVSRLIRQAVGAWATSTNVSSGAAAVTVWLDESRCRCGYNGTLAPVDEATAGDVTKGGVELLSMLKYGGSVLRCERCVPYVAAHKIELRQHFD